MSAGFAAADVSVSGDGRMGVVSSDGVMTFTNRARIKFSGSGTTDGGLAFGGSFSAHEAAAAEATGNSGSVFISGAFGKIKMGSVDSGDSASVGQLAGVGLTSLGSGNSISYAADKGGDGGLPGTFADAGGAKVLYTYSAGALTINASTAQMTDGGATAYGIGGSYAAGALTVGLGYGVVDGGRITGLRVYDASTAAGVAAVGTPDLVTYVAATPAVKAGFYETTALDASVTDLSLSVAYVMDNTTIKAIYQNKTVEASAAARAAVTTSAAAFVHDHSAIALSATATSMGLSVVQKMDALSLTAYGINTTVDADSDLSADNPTVSRYGIGFGYDLGGGASVVGGWATVDALVPAAIAGTTDLALETYTLTSVSADQWDLGLSFSF
jgi:outer membrane protein OmpU